MISRMISGPSMTSNASAWPHGVIAVLYSVSSNDSREHHQKTINFLSFVLRVFVDNLKEAGTFTFRTFHLKLGVITPNFYIYPAKFYLDYLLQKPRKHHA